MEKLTIEKFYLDNKEKLKLNLFNNDASFNRVIEEADLHRPGLALSGFVDVFTFKRIQIIGNTENAYLKKLSATERKKAIEILLSFKLPCIIITHNNKPPAELVNYANQKGVTIFKSPLQTTKLMHLISDYMDDVFAPSITVHGSLVDVYGIGVLFTGRSGIGKSEITLDLVERGHRLVADDVVQISRKAEGILIGEAAEMLQHHLEIRGLGIVDVRSIFGIRSIRLHKRVEVEVQLEEWNQDEEYERVGLQELTSKILEVEVPAIKLPIFSGKNITVIAEAIALDQLLKIHGHYPAKAFNDKLLKRMQEKAKKEKYLQDYLDRDFE
ncbi:MAG: HPr kinase/phosphorylase [Caldithrix sp.]|nr:MAG: HPr kinase/phosphorylase [Caldithrix sp.]TDI99170.1 MAG: HPr kinase/phosphorylase [Caldithrix sp.]